MNTTNAVFQWRLVIYYCLIQFNMWIVRAKAHTSIDFYFSKSRFHSLWVFRFCLSTITMNIRLNTMNTNWILTNETLYSQRGHDVYTFLHKNASEIFRKAHKRTQILLLLLSKQVKEVENKRKNFIRNENKTSYTHWTLNVKRCETS